MTVTVDPDLYAMAGYQLANTANDVSDALNGLTNGQSGNQGMAGSDPQAQSWATQYDSAASTMVSALAQTANGLALVAQLIEISGFNRAEAVAASCVTPMSVGAPSLGSSSIASPSSLPTAWGGGYPEPPGWNLVRDLVGYVWPDGHQDLLNQAGAAWKQIAGTLSGIADDVASDINNLVQSDVAPEIGPIGSICSRAEQSLNGLSTHCTSLGTYCTQFASQIDQAHHKTIKELEQLVGSIVISQAAGWGFSLLTAGLSEAVASGADMGLIAASAARIAAWLGDLADFLDGIISAIGDVLEGIGDALTGVVDTFAGLAPDLATVAADGGSVAADEAGSLAVSGADAVGDSASAVSDASQVSDAGATATNVRNIDRGLGIAKGGVSGMTGDAASNFIGGQPFNPEEVIAGGVLGGFAAGLAPDGSSLVKSMEVNAGAGGVDELNSELDENHWDPSKVDWAKVAGGAAAGGVAAGVSGAASAEGKKLGIGVQVNPDDAAAMPDAPSLPDVTVHPVNPEIPPE